MLRFIDGFDHYTSDASIAQKYNSAGGTSYMQVLTTGGRRGGGCLELYGGSGEVRKILDDQGTWIVGFGFMAPDLDSISASQVLLFLDSAGAIQASLYLNAGLALEVRRGTTTILGTSPTALSAGVWYYIEIKITIHDSTGSAVVHVDAVEKINVSSVDTKNTAIAGARTLALKGLTTKQVRYDDFYVCDSTGSLNTDFLGDVRIDVIYPTATGSVTEFTPNGAANNWDCVNDTEPDGDTTYTTATTVDDTDLLVFGDLPASTGTIFGVQANLNARKDDAGTGGMKAVVLLSSTEYEGAELTMSDAYYDQTHIWEQNPDTTATWAAAEINGAEFGYKVSS